MNIDSLQKGITRREVALVGSVIVHLHLPAHREDRPFRHIFPFANFQFLLKLKQLLLPDLQTYILRKPANHL
jgi:hypothetical protein